MRAHIRTDISVFVASAIFLFVGLYFSLFSSSLITPVYFGGDLVRWRTFVVGLCAVGTLLPFIKDLILSAVPRRVIGIGVLLLPYALALPVLRGELDPMMTAGAAVVLLSGVYAMWRDETVSKTFPYDLFLVAAGAVPVLALVVAAAVFSGHLGLSVAPLVVAATLGMTFIVVHIESPGHQHNYLLRIALGLSLLAVSLEGFFEGRFPTAIVGATFGATALLHPLFTHYRLGVPARLKGIGAEARVVASFRKADEVAARGALFSISVAIFFEPGIVAVPRLLYVMLFATVFAFAAIYRFGDPSKGRYRDVLFTVYANSLVLFTICHVTGGLSSPFTWFLPFVTYGVSFTPRVLHLFGMIAFIALFYVFELFFAMWTGLPWGALAVRHFVPEMLVTVNMCTFLYTAVRSRVKVDAELVQANVALKAGLIREHEQNRIINLAKRRDEALFAALADAVFVLSIDGRVESLNVAASKLTGIKSSDLLGTDLCSAIAVQREDEPSFSLRPTIDAAFSGAQVTVPDNVYLARPGGDRVYLAGYAIPFVLPGGKKAGGAIVTLRDMTAVHDADRMKSDFLSVAAHQLRTPLTNVRWRLEMMTDSVGDKMADETKVFVGDAYAAVRKMVSLIGSILAVTRLESGHVPFQPVSVRLKEITDEIKERIAPAAARHDLTVTIDVPELPPVMLDRALAFEVFANLADNAVRYTPNGGKIDIVARDDGVRFVWSIRDSGIGIPKDQQDKLFRKFFRADNAVEHSAEGSGLGLYLARHIASSWGGDLSFVSVAGKGATFMVTIPKAGMSAKGGSVSLRA